MSLPGGMGPADEVITVQWSMAPHVFVSSSDSWMLADDIDVGRLRHRARRLRKSSYSHSALSVWLVLRHTRQRSWLLRIQRGSRPISFGERC